MAVSKRLRFEVLRRDNHTCRYCGRSAPEVKLTVDHVVPVALGGFDDPSNLVAACSDCNSGKSSVPADSALIDDVASDAIRWSQAMCRAAQELADHDAANNEVLEAVYAAWRPRHIPTGWESSVSQFIQAGLTRETLIGLVRVAQSASGIDDRWAYFCGCCWKRIRQLQERASAIVRGGENSAATARLLTTIWTEQDVDDRVARMESYASRSLTGESIDSAHCRHRKWGEGDCGDPVCRIVRAEALFWMSDSVTLQSMREDSIVEEAEVCLDG